MTYTRRTVCTFLLASLFWAGWVSASNEAAAAEIKWQKYMQSSANVSAIAAAVALVDSCSKKLIIEETISKEKIRLDFICYGTKDDDATSSIEFLRVSDEYLMPKNFLFAG